MDDVRGTRSPSPLPQGPGASGEPTSPASVAPSAPPGHTLLGLEDEPRPLELVNLLLRRRRVLVGLPVAAALVTAALSLLVPATYTATTTFVPEAGRGSRVPAGLAGIASQVGVTLGGDASQSPQFYADLVQSRELMERVLLARYPAPGAGASAADSATLLKILDSGGHDRADSLYRGVKKVRKLVSTDVDRKTNVVRLSVDAHDPVLAARVANRFIAYLNEFNAKTRQSQARERRKFAEDRLAEAEADLRRAEEDLKGFYQRNRSWQQAPQLVFEEGQLRRQVDIRQEVYLTLRREYETARIDEANDVPVITVIDAAVPPTRKSSPKRRLLAVLALLGGGAVAVVWALATDHMARLRREDDGAYREFRGLIEEAQRELGWIAFKVRRRRPDRDTCGASTS